MRASESIGGAPGFECSGHQGVPELGRLELRFPGLGVQGKKLSEKVALAVPTKVVRCCQTGVGRSWSRKEAGLGQEQGREGQKQGRAGARQK